MKFLIIILFLIISSNNYLHAKEIINCDNLNKLSTKYVKCKADEMKVVLNKKKKEVESSTNGKKIKKFTKSKTLMEFINEYRE